jgi:hypothetical protein
MKYILMKKGQKSPNFEGMHICISSYFTITVNLEEKNKTVKILKIGTFMSTLSQKP